MWVLTYDGTTDANTSNFTSTFSNLVVEDLNLTGSGVLLLNVTSGQSITLGSIALANGTAASSNYNLTSATLDITNPINLTGSESMIPQRPLPRLTTTIIIWLVRNYCVIRMVS